MKSHGDSSREHSLRKRIDSRLGSADYDSLTGDWIRCQQLLKRLTSDLVNGVSDGGRFRKASELRGTNPERWTRSAALPTTGPYSSQLAPVLNDKQVDAEMLLKALKLGYRILGEPPIASEGRYRRIRVDDDGLHPNEAVVNKMRQLLNPVSDNVSVYLHGSMAIGDYTAFSDVDDLVVVEAPGWASLEELCRTAAALARTARYFQTVDPLQHHGHWVVLSTELNWLDESTLPPLVLQQACVVTGPEVFEAKTRWDPASFASVLWYQARDVRRLGKELASQSIRLFELKRLVSCVSLIPALIFQMQGTEIDKASAIARSEEILSPEAMLAMSWSTRIRDEWEFVPGYSWVRRMKRINTTLPLPRHYLQEWARRRSPVLGSHLGASLSSLSAIAEEAFEHIEEVVGRDE